MNWQKIITGLNDKGITNAKIQKHAGISFAQLNRLRDGKQKDMMHSVGEKLVELCDLIGVKTE